MPRLSSSGEGLVQLAELKNQWGFTGFCAQKAAVGKSSDRMLLLVYTLWSLFVRVIKN